MYIYLYKVFNIKLICTSHPLKMTENMQQVSSSYSKILCIPRMSKKISKDTIVQVFERFQLGTIVKYRESTSKNSMEYKRVMLQIQWSTTNPKIEYYKALLDENKSLKLVYDFPWFWIMVICKTQVL
jgi:hypothetical protein